MGLFDTLISQVEEADRDVFKKYPKIAEQVDRTEEYVRKWEQWKDDYWDETHGMTKNAIAALADKDNEIEALRLMQTGNDMTWDEMKGNVENLLKSSKVITADAFEKEYLPKLQYAKPEQIEEISKKIDTGFLGMDMVYGESAHLPMKYFKEFGAEAPDFEMKNLFKHMGEKKMNNITQAYDDYVAPLRAKKSDERAKVREDQIREEVRQETLKEITLRQGSLPVDNNGSAPETSALTYRINARRKNEQTDALKLTPGELGSGVGAQDAYQQFLKDAAAGVKPKLPAYLNIQ